MSQNNQLIHELSTAAIELLLRSGESDADYTVAIDFLLREIQSLTAKE
ncbi:hypothetical protein [Pseudoalteromonas sp. Of11M-6]|nr:hypothetical protein [Pseudoalteromonas sp. Of11M-6]MCG7553107.1 hypothetical protein [Pseudoalteromonas sp. Of11M-6]